VEELDEGVVLALGTVWSHDEGEEWHLVQVEVLLVVVMVADVYVGGVHLEKRVAVVPTNNLLVIIDDLLPGKIC